MKAEWGDQRIWRWPVRWRREQWKGFIPYQAAYNFARSCIGTSSGVCRRALVRDGYASGAMRDLAFGGDLGL